MSGDRRGRPQKLTLDFFLHDKDARRDRKIRALRKKHGNDGYATFFCLLEMICDEDGLKLNLSNPVDLEIAVEDCGLRDDAHFYKILITCVEIGLFDKQLWESDRIVFSHALHRRYLDRLEERKQAAIRKKRSRDAKALQSKISAAESSFVTPDNSVTNELSQNGHGIVTPQNYRTTELQNTDLRTTESELQKEKEEYVGQSGDRSSLSLSQAQTVIRDKWASAVQRQEQSFEPIPSWRHKRGVNGYKDDFVKYLADVYLPTTPHYEGKKVSIANAKTWIARNEFDEKGITLIEIQWEAFSNSSAPVLSNGEVDWSQHPNRDRWLAEMREKGRRFFKESGQYDQEKYKFFCHYEREVFPDVATT